MTAADPARDHHPKETEMTTNAATEKVLNDVRIERSRHPEIGYDATHDDHHQIHDLVTWADRYAHKPGKHSGAEPGYYDRYRLVQAASLLVAAIEHMDRRADRG